MIKDVHILLNYGHFINSRRNTRKMEELIDFSRFFKGRYLLITKLEYYRRVLLSSNKFS